MVKEERETLILINRKDMEEGFFVFYTTEASDFRRLCRRIGGRENLRSIRVSRYGGKPVAWDCEVPIGFLSRATWSIGARKRREVTEEQRQAMADRMKSMIKSRGKSRRGSRTG